MADFNLPKKLLLGSATAATQIEGGDKNCNWYQWSLDGKVGNGESSLTGADHYNRFKEDINLLAELNQQCYRMSIEWSRIEPSKGKWSSDGIAHYREELSLLREKGILPLVTLHHFSCPQWFQDKGGWTADTAVEDFISFCEKVVEEFGDIVNEWCTINEPNVFANDTYMDGKYPPGHFGDMKSYFKVSRNMVIAHIKAYKLIHRIRTEKGFSGETAVGFAHHLAYFESSRKGLLASLGRGLITRLFQTVYFKGMVEGQLIAPLGSGYPEGKGCYCDFIGVNYYSRHIITPTLNPGALFGTIDFDPNVPDERKNDLGWEIYPPGLYKVIKKCWDKYKLPIHVTENGLPDADDGKRASFIREHLKEVKHLLDDGVDVRRYYYWSLLDNLEWNDGYGPRFGLIEVDYNTMERHVRPSAEYYAEVCKNHMVKEAIE
ncbi:MAG: glycoside hydrolase family 1 protein [Spirochaetales bacterium]|nr:glycoside hydrolase family 1 protein [Spirochaetales bacterium]